MADRRRRDARGLHGNPRHDDRQRGAAAYRGDAGRLQRRGDLHAHGLSGRQRHRADGVGLDFGHGRAQALLHRLSRHVHRLLVPVRDRDEPRPADHLPPVPGLFRRWFAAEPAGHHPRHVPARQARRGLRPDGGRDHRRTGARADAGRLHHRHLHLALDLLRQRACRHLRGGDQPDPRRRSAVGEGQAEAQDARHRLHRPVAHHHRPRRLPDHDRSRRG